MTSVMLFKDHSSVKKLSSFQPKKKIQYKSEAL